MVRARLRAPFVSAQGPVDWVDINLVGVEDDEGCAGFGEALGGERLDAALDLARWDLAGRRAGEPVWRALGGADAPPVEVNATIARPDRAAAGPDLAIRIDANGAWTVEEALAALRALEPVGIELCEQPAADVEACAEISASSPIPIALDESAPEALDRRVCDAVCLKVARCGGITGLVDAAKRARRAGYGVYLASMLDGPLGIAAALHAAAVVQPDYACGLATLSLFDHPDPLPPVDGRIAVPAGPGLGDRLIEWY